MELRSLPGLSHKIGQPVFQHGTLVGNHVGKGQAHPEVGVRIDHFGVGFEDTLVPENA